MSRLILARKYISEFEISMQVQKILHVFIIMCIDPFDQKGYLARKLPSWKKSLCILTFV